MKNEASEEDLQSTVTTQIAPGEIIIGNLEGIDHQGKPLVSFSELTSTQPIVALSTIALKQQDSGRQIALLFAEGDLSKPVIIGLIHSPLDEMIENFEFTAEADQKEIDKDEDDQDIEHIYLDGKKVIFEGKEEITLKCGDSSITLTNTGKILIRGKYLLSRSTGVNRILGGSVQVN